MSYWTKIIQGLIHFNEKIVFYPRLANFYKKELNKPNLKIIDVGANRGQSIDFFLKIQPNATIFAFEPNLALFDLLKNKYSKNSKIHLFNLGVSNANGELLFNENIMDETSSFEELNVDSKYLKQKAKILNVSVKNIIKKKYLVKTITLQKFLEENPGNHFDILKIDVEGHELSCLEGLFNSNSNILPINYIQLESHSDDMYIKNHNQHEVNQLLLKNNFEKISEIKHGFGDFTDMIYKYHR
ncbi:methyltransferase, FkbM family [Flavobacteriaceae bacterium MAR_2010_188]|nr:methyltransferase, FkbM family [Flavobacteriaceae bacterium MAR_2010_188]